MCKNEEEQEEIIKPSLFVYTLEYIRPCAGGERAIAVYSRNKNVVCEQWYEYTTHTHTYTIRNAREKKREEEINWVSMKKEESKMHHRLQKKKKRK
jgi:predicted solute-binding protein